MPSDPRRAQALAALARPAAEFRALLQGAQTQGEALLAEQAAGDHGRTMRAASELGAFAAGRVDAARFAALLPRTAPLDGATRDALARATGALHSTLDRGDALFVADVPAGGKLGAAIDAALAEAGRAINAVAIVEAVRGGRYDATALAFPLSAPEFLDWNRAARRAAPPLVITIEGSALQPGALTEFADGRQKIVLVVRGPCPSAALARCITPGTFVVQTVSGAGLDRLAAFDGPAVGAMVPAGAAQFVHDPALGREPWQRISIAVDAEPPKRSIGGMSVFQMSEDLRHLHDLARTPFAVPAAGGGATQALGAPDAVERIASWLLSGLPEPR